MSVITPDKFLYHLAALRSPEVMALGSRLRDVVHSAVPDANEVVYHGALCYGRGVKRSQLKVYISFHAAHVNLGFYWGARLSDPEGLLRGTGKQMRHIKVCSASDLKTGAFRLLVREALTD